MAYERFWLGKIPGNMGRMQFPLKRIQFLKTEVDWLKKRRNMLGKEALVLYKRGKALPDGILPRYSPNGAGCREIGLQCAAKRWEHD